MWHEIKTRRDIPKEVSYVVTRRWSSGESVVTTEKVVKYKGKNHWVKDEEVRVVSQHFPYDNVVAWDHLPEPFV